ncbi:hypothetical protein PENSUB_2931 [Penicillium subrubescens]|uniref:Uncharacterized protein n=1 Tax=Penicillium subrubescens TaxID=1316194 RepID=A0A1Q5UG40_9EURO|nr:hypothetical protein PENSUB_2931 [Penicillium subrubescens]
MYCPKHKSGQCLEYYAIRVYVGQINAITGKNMMEERGTQDEQDYIIFPGQPWIDGICVAPGVWALGTPLKANKPAKKSTEAFRSKSSQHTEEDHNIGFLKQKVKLSRILVYVLTNIYISTN